MSAWSLVLQTYHEEDEVGQPTEDEGSNNNSKLSRELTNQKWVLYCINQSEASIIFCQPIRSKYYIVSTNQRWVLYDVPITWVAAFFSLARMMLPITFLLFFFPCFPCWEVSCSFPRRREVINGLVLVLLVVLECRLFLILSFLGKV